MYDKIEVSRNLYLARICNNFNQIDLVNKSGLTRPIISGIENGIANPTLDTILKLSNTLNINIESLFLSEKKYFKLKKLLRSEFEKSKRTGFELYIPDDIWKKLMKFSNDIHKNNYKNIAGLCNQVIKLNFQSTQDNVLIQITFNSTLGVIFQKDGFLFGIEFGAWLGRELY